MCQKIENRERQREFAFLFFLLHTVRAYRSTLNELHFQDKNKQISRIRNKIYRQKMISDKIKELVKKQTKNYDDFLYYYFNTNTYVFRYSCLIQKRNHIREKQRERVEDD